VLAVPALGLEIRETLLECQPKYINVDQVAKLLAHQPKEVPKNERSE
jgi:hypothetical protein